MPNGHASGRALRASSCCRRRPRRRAGFIDRIIPCTGPTLHRLPWARSQAPSRSPFRQATTPTRQVSSSTPIVISSTVPRRGDRNAFEALLRRHYDRIHRVAWRLTGSRVGCGGHRAGCLLHAGREDRQLQGRGQVHTWLTGIVVNACRDHRRRGLTLTRLRERLSVLAGLAPPPDGRDAYRRSWLRASSRGSTRCCGTRLYLSSGRT